jgi:hypothetical protein
VTRLVGYALEALPLVGLLLLALAAGLAWGIPALLAGLGAAMVLYWLMLEYLGDDTRPAPRLEVDE